MLAIRTDFVVAYGNWGQVVCLFASIARPRNFFFFFVNTYGENWQKKKVTNFESNNFPTLSSVYFDWQWWTSCRQWRFTFKTYVVMTGDEIDDPWGRYKLADDSVCGQIEYVPWTLPWFALYRLSDLRTWYTTCIRCTRRVLECCGNLLTWYTLFNIHWFTKFWNNLILCLW